VCCEEWVAMRGSFAHNAPASLVSLNLPRRFLHYGGLIGPLAILVREPGQVRKEAAEAYDVCAGMWLVGLPPKFSRSPETLVKRSLNRRLSSI
jgi:hypothetical protein